ncbi:bifunctional tetrahydrofolate synthase/dihydrofolate synthase [Thiospirillum jenense]|uniref:Dihydrofolate synthase/folylpolyglutamate synthase n=1 Tax=Thiospirillum jenense TaxID=1653858 RepID=A0A839HFG9_9GAMM|nr:bifunctional tetrahydrofolate synthase/dihydrofolate synthase [Thiospirillum jenense]MBB1127184.1 bifunctional tetrahydrofolate synthase/dihydrofolate synthase [Thiospirillum jenense]
MRFNTLAAWLAWQETLHPQRIELRLERVATVWSRLWSGDFPAALITVGGTNGKGSCVALLDNAYRAAGYRCCSYTSPHLLRYNERINLNGQPVSDADLCAAFERVDQARSDLRLTYFEFGTLAALDLFARAAPDVVILEVGLGGRLDAVNILGADVALVTSIGYDHTAWLGDTLDQIAVEKAGIFRPQRPAVIGQRDAPARLRQRAEDIGATVSQLGHEFDWQQTTADSWQWRGNNGVAPLALPLPRLRGQFQLDNAAAVAQVIECLSNRLPVPVTALRQALLRTSLAGRFQVIPGAVNWILDVAHNPAAAATLADNLRRWRHDHAGAVHAVVAIFSDKDAVGIAQQLAPVIDTWHLAAAASERALPVEQLAAAVATAQPSRPYHNYPDLNAALHAVQTQAHSGDTVLVTGSFVTVEAALHTAGMTII